MQPHKLTRSPEVSPSKPLPASPMKISGSKLEPEDLRQKKAEPKPDGPGNDGPKDGELKHDGCKNRAPKNHEPTHANSKNQSTHGEKPANIDAAAAPSPPPSLAPLLEELDLNILLPGVERSDLPEVTDQQHRAIFALVAGKSMSAAAVVAGVHRGTVLRWLRDNDHFAAEYNAFQAETRDKARARLLKAVDDAVDVVINALQNHDPRTAIALLSKLAILVPLTPGPTTACEVREQREMQTKMKEMMRQIEELMIRVRLS